MSKGNSPNRPRLALIAGPTASGKSGLALAMAHRTGGVVINADASQVYRDLRILTARPSPQEEALADHRLYGTVDGAVAWSAADWAAEARRVIAAVHAEGRLPILVGGSGLYLRTLIDGIAPVPPIDPAIRDAVRALPVAEAHAALVALDPAAATRLNRNDTTRVTRALEVVRATGRTLADWQQRTSGGIGDRVDLRAVILDPPVAPLYARCDARFAMMIEQGALDEVAALLARRLDPALPVMRAIGVTPLADLLAGRITHDAAVTAAAQATRNYAKRQRTWFRNQPPPAWRRIDADPAALPLDAMSDFLTGP